MKLATSNFPRARAFTIIEIAISLGIIGFALVAIISILPSGLTVQRDNREETTINFEAAFFMDAIRNGARGQDDLTNYVVAVTNWAYRYQFTRTTTNIQTSTLSYFTDKQFSVRGAVQNYPFLTNGQNIIGLLTTPKYTDFIFTDPVNGWFTSNYVSADFRGLSGPASDQSVNARDFAFTYRLEPQIIPDNDYDPSTVDYNATGLTAQERADRTNNWTLVSNLRNNLSQVRLRFRWPVLASGGTGNGRQTFRSAASGQIITNVLPTKTTPALYLFQPRSYGYAGPN